MHEKNLRRIVSLNLVRLVTLMALVGTVQAESSWVYAQRPLGDLEPTFLTACIETDSWGLKRRLSINGTIANNGLGPVDQSNALIRGSQDTIVTISPLEPDTEVLFRIVQPLGDNLFTEVSVTANFDGQAAEANPDNNRLTTQVKDCFTTIKSHFQMFLPYIRR